MVEMVMLTRKRGGQGQGWGEDALGGPEAVVWMEARSKLRPKLGGRTQPCGEHALRLLYTDLHLLLRNTHPGVSGTG